MHETERPNPSEQWRQGDIVQFEDPNGQTPTPGYGVIINADCDLKNSKIDGVISYLPVYPFRDYIRLFWAPSYVQRQRTASTSELLKVLKLNDTDEPDLLRLVSDGEIQPIVEKLSREFDAKASLITEKIEKIRICLAPTDPLATFFELCRREGKPEDYARKQVKDAQKKHGRRPFFH